MGGFWLLRLFAGVEGGSAACNSQEREWGRGEDQGKQDKGEPPVSAPLPRGKRHDINERAYVREEETKQQPSLQVDVCSGPPQCGTDSTIAPPQNQRVSLTDVSWVL